MSAPGDCSVTVNVGPPILQPFRTGSYLIYDDEPPGKTNFRKGTHLSDVPFRASGSRQLNVLRLTEALRSVAPPRFKLYLVDLRQETHLFYDDRAVSWYADRDFANVGQTPAWIVAEEAAQLARIKALPTTQLFCINKDNQELVTPTGYSELTVKSAKSEEGVAAEMAPQFRPTYVRIPVTDHCKPGGDALLQFIKLCDSLSSGDWLHCHCHGGDGRTTTFLALFDMISWAKSRGKGGFPTLEEFASRQCLLFSYCLNPNGCGDTGQCIAKSGHATNEKSPARDWKYYLAVDRWKTLKGVRDWIANGGLGAGEPFTLPQD